MSNRSCNYCRFQQIETQAKRNGMKIHKTSGMMGGVDIYILPKDINFKDLTIRKASESEPNGSPDHEKYFRAWFMELPNHCAC